MLREDLIKSVKESHKKCLEIMDCKGADYANNEDALLNYKYCELLDVSAEKYMLCRVIEKICRVNNLFNKDHKTADESITDSLLDISNVILFIKAHIDEKRLKSKKI